MESPLRRPDDVSSLVEEILELTDQVQSAIGAGDWPRANELEIERRRQLDHIAAAQLGARELAPALAAIEGRTQRLIGLVQHHRRRVLREAAGARTAHEGVAAYAEATAAEASE